MLYRVCCLCVLACVSWWHAPEARAGVTYEVDLHSTSLSDGLVEFAKQAGISIVFSETVLPDSPSPEIHGTFTLRQILDRMLEGVCVHYEFVRPTLIALKAGCSPEPVTTSLRPYQPLVARDPPQRIEEVVVIDHYVTASRIRNPSFGSPMPVDIIERVEIEQSGFQTVGDLLRYIPAVSGNSTSTLVSNGGDGTATVTLRGLPDSNTLVLLNGRRMNPDALTGAAIDLNTLPMGFVDRIEIVKEGASAIYGSDAVAGVVNIITRTDVHGLALNAYAGAAGEGDLQTQNLSAIYGWQTNKWHFTGGLSFFDQAPLYSRDRNRSRSSDDRSKGGVDKRSSATAPARVTVDGDAFILADEDLDGSEPSHFQLATPEDRFEYRDFTTSIVPSTRWSAFYAAAVEVGTLELYGEGLITHTKASNTLAPSPLFAAFESLEIVVDADNQFNPFGEDIYDIRRRFVELPPREQINKSRTERFAVGLRNRDERFRWDLTLLSSVTKAEESFNNSLLGTSLQNALSGDCFAPCVPLNLFGPPGSITDEMLNYVSLDTRGEGKSRLRSITVNVDLPLFNLPAGMMEMASGAVYRKEFLGTRPDPVLAAFESVGAANYGPTRGDRSILEAYAELYIPLLKDLPGISKLELHLAGRVSHYDDFGRETNPRITLRYTAIPSLSFRATYAHGFRAPTLNQLYASEFQSFDQLNDPCSIAANVGTKPGCTVQSDPTLVQFMTIKGGDPNLKAERSKNMNFGIAWVPDVGENRLEVTVDLYRIRQVNVVDSSSQYVLNENANTGRFQDRVIRDGNGNIKRILATLLNIGERDVQGVDASVTLQLAPSKWGQFSVALNATHIRKYVDKFDPTTPSVDQAGTFSDDASEGNGALPDWKASLGVNWHHKRWQAQYNLYSISAVDELIPIIEQWRSMEAWYTHNIQIGYRASIIRGIRISAGVNNLFDREPPFSAAAFNDSYDARTYDITGRYWYLQAQKSI
ncbi:MAG: TonB-dependent receptor [Gammaproteobacteria bacterium]|nr:TonB-dependent receptor [Gammaproteobacteria bacterium]